MDEHKLLETIEKLETEVEEWKEKYESEKDARINLENELNSIGRLADKIRDHVSEIEAHTDPY